MLSARNFLKLCLITTLGSSLPACAGAPKVERCLTTEDHLVCHDDRLPKDRQDFTREYAKDPEAINQVCHPANDYFTLREWCLRKQKEYGEASGCGFISQ